MACELAQLFNIKICLENETGIFHPPESLDGYVDASLSDDLVVHEMGIWFIGQAALLWTEEDDSKSVKKMKCLYGGRQTLVKSYHSFCDNATTTTVSSDALLCAGTHRFPFHFHLPANMPSSFEAADSSENEHVAVVQYKLICVFHNVKLHATHSQSLAIIVQRSYDLSLLPDTLYKTTLKRCLKSQSALCGSQVYGDVELVVNKTGFVPGETVQVSVQVANVCGPVIKSTYLLLKQTVVVHIGDEDKSFARLLFCTNLGKCPTASQKRVLENIHVPPVVASELRGCSIIHVTYVVSVFLVLRRRNRIWGSPFDFHETSIPIIIGTDPHRETTFPSNAEVVPCYAYFNHKTGKICEYSHERDLNDNSRPVYRYYKVLPLRSAHPHQISTGATHEQGASNVMSSRVWQSPPGMPVLGSTGISTNRLPANTNMMSNANLLFNKSSVTMDANHYSQSEAHQQAAQSKKPTSSTRIQAMNKSHKFYSTDQPYPPHPPPTKGRSHFNLSTSSGSLFRMSTGSAGGYEIHIPTAASGLPSADSRRPPSPRPSSRPGLYAAERLSCSCESLIMGGEEDIGTFSHPHVCAQHQIMTVRFPLARTSSSSGMGMEA